MFGFFRRRDATYRELQDLHQHVHKLATVLWKAIHELQRKDIDMANDITRLNASITALEAKVDAMPPPAPDIQADLDAAADRVDAVTAKIPAAPTPPAP